MDWRLEPTSEFPLQLCGARFLVAGLGPLVGLKARYLPHSDVALKMALPCLLSSLEAVGETLHLPIGSPLQPLPPSIYVPLRWSVI